VLARHFARYEWSDLARAGLRTVRHNLLNRIASLAHLELTEIHGPSWTAVLRKIATSLVKTMTLQAVASAPKLLAPPNAIGQAGSILAGESARVASRLSDAGHVISHQAAAVAQQGARTARDVAANVQVAASALKLKRPQTASQAVGVDLSLRDSEASESAKTVRIDQQSAQSRDLQPVMKPLGLLARTTKSVVRHLSPRRSSRRANAESRQAALMHEHVD